MADVLISPDGLWRWDGRQWVPTSVEAPAHSSPPYPGLPPQDAMNRTATSAATSSTRRGGSALTTSALIAAVLGLALSLTTVLFRTVYIFGELDTGDRPWFEDTAFIFVHFAVASIALVLAILGVRRHRGWVTTLVLALASVAFYDSLLRVYFLVITKLKYGH